MKPFSETCTARILGNVIGAPAEGLVKTALSLVRDKTKNADTSFIKEKIRNGISISSKRMINLTGFGSMITVGLTIIIKNPDHPGGYALCGLAVIHSIGMAIVTYLTEKHKSN